MLHYITLSYYLVYARLLSLLQLFFCLHVRLIYVIKYYFTLLYFISRLDSLASSAKNETVRQYNRSIDSDNEVWIFKDSGFETLTWSPTRRSEHRETAVVSLIASAKAGFLKTPEFLSLNFHTTAR